MKNVFSPAAFRASLIFLTAVSSANASISVWDINNVADISGAFTINGNTVTAYNGNIMFLDNSHATNNGFIVSGGPINPATSLSFNQGTISSLGNGQVINFTTSSTDGNKSQTDSFKLYFNGNINNQGTGPITLTDAVLTETDPSMISNHISSTPTATIDLLMTEGDRCDTRILSNITDPNSNVPEPTSIALMALGFLGFNIKYKKIPVAIPA